MSRAKSATTLRREKRDREEGARYRAAMDRLWAVIYVDSASIPTTCDVVKKTG